MKDQTIEVATITSIELLDIMSNFKDLKTLHQAIRNMFNVKIDDLIIRTSLDSRGHVAFLTLPEVESKMFVTSRDIEYLEAITQYWDDKNRLI